MTETDPLKMQSRIQQLEKVYKAALSKFEYSATTCLPSDCLECTAKVEQCSNAELGRALAGIKKEPGV